MLGDKQPLVRLPKSLDLAKFVRSILDSTVGEDKKAILADRLSTTVKTLDSWLHAQVTSIGPSVRLNKANFEALCAEGRNHGCNPELFFKKPVIWNEDFSAQLPDDQRLGRRFRSHGLKFGSAMIESPIVVLGGPLTDQTDHVLWFFKQGASMVESKTRLSTERPPRKKNQLLALAEIAALNLLEYPRKAHPVLIQDLDRECNPSTTFGYGARYGAPSPAPVAWLTDTDRIVNTIGKGQLFLLSIGGFSVATDKESLLSNWQKSAQYANGTGAHAVVMNVSCNVFGSLYQDIELISAVVSLVRKEIRTKDLYVKLSYLPEPQLERLLLAIGDKINGVIGINCEPGIASAPNQEGVVKQVWNDFDSLIGISGPALFPLCKAFLQHFVRIRQRHKELGHLHIIAGGGVTQTGQALELLNLGANAVGVHSGLFDDVYFVLKLRRFIDSNWDRRGGRMQEEHLGFVDVWNRAYHSLIADLPVDSEEFMTYHQNAIRLLDEGLKEMRNRILSLEHAAQAVNSDLRTMSIAEMIEKMREGF